MYSAQHISIIACLYALYYHYPGLSRAASQRSAIEGIKFLPGAHLTTLVRQVCTKIARRLPTGPGDTSERG